MALFKIESNDKKLSLIIRHRCISCVRKMAITFSPEDEFDIWAYDTQSKVTLQQAVEFSAEGKNAILKRVDNR